MSEDYKPTTMTELGILEDSYIKRVAAIKHEAYMEVADWLWNDENAQGCAEQGDHWALHQLELAQRIRNGEHISWMLKGGTSLKDILSNPRGTPTPESHRDDESTDHRQETS